MKKKILTTILCAAVLCTVWPMAACSNGKPHEHTWDSGEITTPATCATVGIKTYTCTGCNETKTETVAKTEHLHSEVWLKNDDEHWHAATCEHTSERVGVGAHVWDEGQTVTAATCLKTGLIKYSCLCGLTKTQPVEKTPHPYKTDWNLDESKHWHVCSTEGCTAISGEHAHNWDNGEITTPATCLAEGVKTYTCTDCKYTKTESVAILSGHVYSNEWSADENGHYRVCTTSGCTAKTDEHVHNFGGWTQAGQMVKICSVCYYEYPAPSFSVGDKALAATAAKNDDACLTFFTRGTGYYTFTFTASTELTVSIAYYDRTGKYYNPEFTLTQTDNSFSVKLWERSVGYLTVKTASEQAIDFKITASYSETPPKHTHSFATEWSTDSSYHWHPCTGDGCEEEQDTGLHEFVHGVCTVCGFDSNND